ncbi:hypothetical protein [Nocardioides sp. Soil774]|uniref:hypothetical protein n=1 Tax=Nocardioides sp. Soil774 TaxID=1736408 RepID=UPI0012FCA1AE|nr:hypothetical protein [Nocardioides sp. Soil774]
MSFTTAQAAEALGVTPARVRALAKCGRLQAVRGEQGQLLIDAGSVEAQRLSSSDNAPRAMSQPIAWAVADLLDGGTAPWISASERSRLKRRLSERPLDPILVRRWLAKRADTTTIYGINQRSWSRLMTGFPEVVRAAEFLYVTSELENMLVRRLRLRPVQHDRSVITIRTVVGGYHLRTQAGTSHQATLPRLMRIADLLDSPERQHQLEGQTVLTKLVTAQSS